MDNKKYFAYIRKSTDTEDKQELSLDAQKRIIGDNAKRDNLVIVKWFEEKLSARKKGRPVFNELLEKLETTDITGVICHKPDRLTRNLWDSAKINEMMEHGKDFIFVSGSYPNNAQGKLMFNISTATSKWYVDNLSEETKKGQEQSIIKGFSPGSPPLGYLTKREYLALTGEETDKREIDPSRAPIVKKAYELYDIGKLSIDGVVEWSYKNGFRGKDTAKRPSGKVGKGAWYNILTNPFYYGWFKWLGKIHKGTHTPIVDYELWERVGRRLKLKGHRFQLLYEFPFKVEQMHCGGCGAGITAEQKFQVICPICKFKFWYKNKRMCPKCKIPLTKMDKAKYLHYIYYHCTRSRFKCTETSVRHEYLQQVFEEAIDKITLPSELGEIFREELKQGFKEEQNLRDVSLQNLNRERGRIQEKHDRLLELYIDQSLDKASYDKKNIEYEDEKQKIEIEIERYKKLDKQWFDTAVLYLELSQSAGKLFKNASDERKNELLNFVFQNLTLKDKKIDFTYKKPFDILVNCQNRTLMLPR
ncbi:MAG: Recombinase [Candidatus Woesebacteria bacterium GW2011_GWC1_38_13]|uniref:Recombinase n=2 Tax=Candidatus Woeseibacteriota TaxID=1752722 RepID=A0A0G0IY51_9BACT|nr:MAG: Recombinase [Candidatus Woesebacteria bacterium GW2011_GWD1_38_10]KKQ56005.1 MAG: Recombinase [Candidatus Woesebacteria bacterium GW2011_GWC1_38_13]